MMNKPNVQCFLILSILVSSVCFSAVEFIMVSPTAVAGETTLNVGDDVVIQIQAQFDADPAPGNGVVFWELDFLLDEILEGGILTISSFDIFLPEGPAVITSGFLAPNSPVQGAGEYFGIFALPHPSDVCIGGYDLLAEVTLSGIGEGTLDYELGNFSIGGNDNGSGASLTGYFNANGSDTVFTVVPEPASLLVLAGMGMLARIRRS